jgi:hypothetical protein
MNLRVMYGEVEISRLIKNSGGRWNREIKLWELSYREVVSLGLEERIVR